MGLSAGTGSPIVFMCSSCRKRCKHRWGCHHTTTLTRCWRKRSSGLGHARGIRNSRFEVEYTCTCGHSGWSSHVDLVSDAVADKVIPEAELDETLDFKIMRRYSGRRGGST